MCRVGCTRVGYTWPRSRPRQGVPGHDLLGCASSVMSDLVYYWPEALPPVAKSQITSKQLYNRTKSRQSRDEVQDEVQDRSRPRRDKVESRSGPGLGLLASTRSGQDLASASDLGQVQYMTWPRPRPSASASGHIYADRELIVYRTRRLDSPRLYWTTVQLGRLPLVDCLD